MHLSVGFGTKLMNSSNQRINPITTKWVNFPLWLDHLAYFERMRKELGHPIYKVEGGFATPL